MLSRSNATQPETQGRDFRGHGEAMMGRAWPNGARLAVSVVVNVEEGAELSLSHGDERNDSVYEAVEEVTSGRDLCMESHFEYGTRVGWGRIRDVLRTRGSPHAECLRTRNRVLTLARAGGRRAGARIVLPRLAMGAARGHGGSPRARGDRPCGGSHPRRMRRERPIGWHTRSATSVNTRRLLAEEGGFLYDSNCYNDDTPYIVEQGGRPHIVLPYAFDTNDMRFQRNGGFVFGDDFARYCIDAFDRLYAEGARQPRMLSIGLHLRIIGRPGRIAGLERFLDHALARPGVWFARRDAIAREWRKLMDLPEWAPCPPTI